MKFVPIVIIIAAAVAASAPVAQPAANYYCPQRLVTFVDRLTDIDGSLSVGINFREYRRLLTRANVAYSRIPFKQLDRGCLSYVGVPAERALRDYTKAHNTWSKCIDELLDCSEGGYYDNIIQRHWRNASRNVSRAVNNLDN